jgi:hypothetical protein
MAVKNLAANIFEGLNADTKPTNVPANSIFITTDPTRSIYIFDGTSTWNQISGGSTGTYVGTYKYLIFKDAADANKYKARNSATGVIDFNNATDLGAMLNAMITSLAEGDTLVFVPGSYTGATDFVITNKARIRMIGNGSTINGMKFRFESATGYNDTAHCIIDGFYFNGAATGLGFLDCLRPNVTNCTFDTCTVGISIGCAIQWTEAWNIRDCYWKNCTTGLQFKTPTSTGTGSYINGNLQNYFFDKTVAGAYKHIEVQAGAEIDEGLFLQGRLWFNADSGSGIHITGTCYRLTIHRLVLEQFVASPTAINGIVFNTGAVISPYFLDRPVWSGTFTNKILNTAALSYDSNTSTASDETQIPLGVSSVYGTTITFNINNRNINQYNTPALGMPRVFIEIAGTVGLTEVLTVDISSVFVDGTSRSMNIHTFSAITAGTGIELSLFDHTRLAPSSGSNMLEKITARAFTNLGSTSAQIYMGVLS